MTRTIIIQQITPVFQKVFNDTALTLLPEHSAADFDKWDSINHVILIARIEKLMKINISTRELIKNRLDEYGPGLKHRTPPIQDQILQTHGFRLQKLKKPPRQYAQLYALYSQPAQLR